MAAIQKRNLLRKINYTSFWKRYIDGFDFSNILDIDVLELGNITEAVIILQQIYYAFYSGGIDNPHDEAEIDKFVDEEDEAAGEAVGAMDEAAGATGAAPALGEAAGQDTLQLPEEIKDMLKSILVSSGDAMNVVELVKRAKEEVESSRAIFVREAERANKLEEDITQLEGDPQTRSKATTVGHMTEELRVADEGLGRLRIPHTIARLDAAARESELDEIKGRIVADITGLIGGILRSKTVASATKAVIKNIIMRNKLKNILKMGILYKVLTLQQVIIFFRGLENNILNIVDPSCFVLRKKDPLHEVPGTPQLPDSQGMQDEGQIHTPNWNEKLAELAFTAAAAAAAAAKRRKTGSGGGTKRKKSMRSYSRKRRTRRKHRTRRKRRATRRYRRIRN